MGTLWSNFVSLLEQLLLWFSIFAGSMGIGIIIFTAVTRVVMLPLTLKSIHSSRKMQELQPLIKELQRKYGKEPKKLQEETVKLYQQYKINPVGGCLPMLLQLPIFIGVYQAVIRLMLPQNREHLSETVKEMLQNPAVAEMVTRPFLGINLGLAPFGDDGFNGVIYLVLPVLSVVMQLMQQLMAMPRAQDPQQKAMSQAMLIMPFVFGYIAFTFPAGAVLYWVTSSTIGVIQQYFTSGWGTLANYLTFLPADRTRTSTLTLPAPTSAVTDGEVVVQEGGTVAVAQRSSFWDVVGPLLDRDSSAAAAEEPADSPPDQTMGTARRQEGSAAHSRRPRRRR